MVDTRLALLTETADIPGAIQTSRANRLNNQLREAQIGDIPLAREAATRSADIAQQNTDISRAGQEIKIRKFLDEQTEADREEGIRTARSFLEIQSQGDLDLFRASNPEDSKNMSPIFGSDEFLGGQRTAQMLINASEPLPDIQKPSSAVAKINADEAAGFITPDQANALRAKATSIGKGTQLTLNPDGSFSFSQGGAVGDDAQITPNKPTINKIDQAILSNQERLDRVDIISGGFDPKFFEVGNRISAKASEIKEKLGLGTLSQEEKTELEELSLFRRDAIASLNTELKEASGTAVSASEAERLLAQLPNAGTGLFDGDSATVFASKMRGVIRDLKRSQARLIHARTKGLDFSDIPLGNIDAIIDRRGQELLDLGMSNEAVKERLKKEFGI